MSCVCQLISITLCDNNCIYCNVWHFRWEYYFVFCLIYTQLFLFVCRSSTELFNRCSNCKWNFYFWLDLFKANLFCIVQYFEHYTRGMLSIHIQQKQRYTLMRGFCYISTLYFRSKSTCTWKPTYEKIWMYSLNIL